MTPFDVFLSRLDESDRALTLAWFAARPPGLRALAEHFPPATKLEACGELVYVVGYGETTGDETILLVSSVDPVADYEGAAATCRPVCSCCGPSVPKAAPS